MQRFVNHIVQSGHKHIQRERVRGDGGGWRAAYVDVCHHGSDMHVTRDSIGMRHGSSA